MHALQQHVGTAVLEAGDAAAGAVAAQAVALSPRGRAVDVEDVEDVAIASVREQVVIDRLVVAVAVGGAGGVPQEGAVRVDEQRAVSVDDRERALVEVLLNKSWRPSADIAGCSLRSYSEAAVITRGAVQPLPDRRVTHKSTWCGPPSFGYTTSRPSVEIAPNPSACSTPPAVVIAPPW